ncbi:MAG: trypsin-like peptidase domain-containing protein [Patescibacteria group bacterium]
MVENRSSIFYVGLAIVSSALTTLALLTLAANLRTGFFPLAQTDENKTLNVPKDAPPSDFEAQTIGVVNHAQPAVVAVAISANLPNAQNRFGSLSLEAQTEAQNTNSVRVAGGSGFFVSSDGLIVTNRHVVKNELFGTNVTYSIRTDGGKIYPATLVAVDPVLDLAFLKVEGRDFPILRFADSDRVVTGQSVIAIGNALDEFDNTVTRGVVSGINRRVVAGDGATSEVIEEAVQTDAAINPGNSGGPLLDLRGQVVGVNTAISDRGQLLGFAIPSNAVSRVLSDVQKFGRIIRPFLGIRYLMLTPDIAREDKIASDHGALVLRGGGKDEAAITPNSPADKAGIKENDIILEIDGQKLDEEHPLAAVIRRHAVGEEVTLKYLRAGTEYSTVVKLEELKTE